VGRGSILRSTLPAQWAVRQPRQVEVPVQGIMSVRSPVTTLDCNLLKDRSLTLVPRQGPNINSQAFIRSYQDSAIVSDAGSPASPMAWLPDACPS
jgi:hypothetical protein